MKILTELSGFGHYGIWSIVPYPAIERLRAASDRFPEWKNPESRTNERGRVGIDYSLINYGYDDAIRFGWSPYHLPEAMKSVALLDRFVDPQTKEEKLDRSFSDQALEVIAYPISHGWNVKANFGDPIWDVIESDRFPERLPNINQKIKRWWQDRDNEEMGGQSATVFEGIDGRTLQVYHPSGNGLWIVGSRNNSHSSLYQIADHNTDSHVDALAHVYALCVILEECRKQLLDCER